MIYAHSKSTNLLKIRKDKTYGSKITKLRSTTS